MEGSLDKVLFVAQLVFLIILVFKLAKNTSNVNIKCVRKLKQLKSYIPITSNNCNNVFPPVLHLYSVTPGVVLEEEQLCIT